MAGSILHWLLLCTYALYIRVRRVLICIKKMSRGSSRTEPPVKVPRHVAVISDGVSPMPIERLIEKCLKYRVDVLSLYGKNIQTRILQKEPVTFYENDRLLQTPGRSSKLSVIYATFPDPHDYYIERLKTYLKTTTSNSKSRFREELLNTVLKPFDLVDLVICMRPSMDITPMLAPTVGFAQLYHETVEELEAAFENAIMSYSQCKQNYGK